MAGEIPEEECPEASAERVKMRVNCNISAIIANSKLTTSQSRMDTALERLSSGLKINSAEDDAAGLAIANKLNTQIKGLDQANKNTSDGISVVQTAESALSELESILQRIRELSVQAANGTNCSEDREAIQQEVSMLTEEIDRIAVATEFNTMPLLDGALNRRSYSDTDNVSTVYVSSAVNVGKYSMTVNADATQASAAVAFDAAAITEPGEIVINGAMMTVDPDDTENTLMEKFTKLCDASNLSYDSASRTITTYDYGISRQIEYSISDTLDGVFQISNVTSGTDAQVSLGAGFDNTATVTVNGRYATVTDFGGFEMKIELGATLVQDNGGAVNITQNVTSMGTMTVQLGANEGQILEIDIPQVNIHSLGLDYLNVSTEPGAADAITRVDSAISEISNIRSKLGAYQNRLESVVTHLDAYEENITSAVSTIEDSDMADEMTEYTQQSVITQAATSMLAQANERPQSVLQLLQ